MKLPRLTLKQRLAIALAAVAALHLAFYFIPRYIATRPHFDEAAHNEAVAMLKEEVGAAAVESGAFSIPRAPVSCPYRGEAIIADSQWGLFLDIDGDYARLIRCDRALELPYTVTARAAVIGREKARRIWDAVSLLNMTMAAGAAAYMPVEPGRALKLADRTWPAAHVEWVEYDPSAPYALKREIVSRAAARYAVSLCGSTDFAWTADRDTVERALVDTLRRSYPTSGGSLDIQNFASCNWLVDAESYLASFASARAGPFFRARIARDSRWLEKVPLLNRFSDFFADRSYVNNSWIWQRLAGRSPSEQLAIVSSAAFDETNPDRNQWQAAVWFLSHNSPQEFRRLCAGMLKTPSVPVDWDYFDYLRTTFPGDATLVDILTARPDFHDDPKALAEAYEVTKKHEYIDALMQYALRPAEHLTLPPESDMAQWAVYVQKKSAPRHFDAASRELARIYLGHRSLGEIPDFLLAHAAMASDPHFYEALAARGSDEDQRFLGSAALNEVPEYSALPKNTSYLMRWNAIGECQRPRTAMDDHLADRFVEYLDSEPAPFADEAQYVKGVIGALGRARSPKALQFIEKIWAQGSGAQADNAPLPYTSLYNISHTDSAPLRGTLLKLRLRFSASLIDAVQELAPAAAHTPASYYQFVPVLAERYSVADLECFLAEGKYALIRGYIYAALVMKREMEVRR